MASKVPTFFGEVIDVDRTMFHPGAEERRSDLKAFQAFLCNRVDGEIFRPLASTAKEKNPSRAPTSRTLWPSILSGSPRVSKAAFESCSPGVTNPGAISIR